MQLILHLAVCVFCILTVILDNESGKSDAAAVGGYAIDFTSASKRGTDTAALVDGRMYEILKKLYKKRQALKVCLYILKYPCGVE